MELLDRGTVAFDVAHGRIWFEPEGLRAPLALNLSGIGMRFVEDAEGKRRLRIIRLGDEAPARRLKERGLRVGREILRVDGRSAGEYDLWAIEQKLTARASSTVRLEWEEADGSPRSEMLLNP